MGRLASVGSTAQESLEEGCGVEDAKHGWEPEGGVGDLLSEYRTYAFARGRFLNELGRATSCRDPLSEFSEVLVARLLGARIAASRVQEGYDLIRRDGRHVQVRSLANAGENWTNEHHVKFAEGVDDYALVIFMSLQVRSVMIFRRDTISHVCAELKKRHSCQEATLQLTKRNYVRIVQEIAKFRALGVEVRQFTWPEPT